MKTPQPCPQTDQSRSHASITKPPDRAQQASPPATAIARSPRMTAQRQALRAAFGDNAASAQLQADADQQLLDEVPVPATAARFAPMGRAAPGIASMPGQLKSGIEALPGLDTLDMRQQRSSAKLAQLNAPAVAHGNDHHQGLEQERHLGRGAWHVAQQGLGRVRTTIQRAVGGVNDDAGQQRDADLMGEGAESGLMQLTGDSKKPDLIPKPQAHQPRPAMQRRMAEAINCKVTQRALQGAAVAGEFTDIPKGQIGTTLQDWKILADFNMKAKFSPDHTAAGQWGEFRQYIRGYFRTTNHATNASSDLKHPLCPGTYLHETNWQEDGDAGGGYGRRANSAGGDQYTDLGAGGSKYEGEDHPESDPVQAGNTLRMHLEFKGQLIATGGGVADTVLAESLWSIDKSRKRNA